MDASRVAVATITWARTEAEEAQLGRSLDRLGQAGLPVAVADKGTSATFSQFLGRHSAFRVTGPCVGGLVAQVQASLAAAAAFDRPFVLYVEPDKDLFFRDHLSDFLRRAPDTDDVGVILAGRSEQGFRTFPEMQRYTEGLVNRLCGQLLGCPGDFTYGPFLMRRELLPDIGTFHRQIGWGWRLATFAAARRRGFRLVRIVDDYTCPATQQSEDDAERDHRIRQFHQNVLGLLD